MQLRTLELTSWRSYRSVNVEFGAGLTAVIGANGQGKTNLLEAIGWLAGLGSFRGAPDDALVRVGADAAILRATVDSVDGREQLIEAEIPRVGRNRIQVNRQRLARAGDLLGVVQVTVFSPTDLELVKGGPALRRGWIDDALSTRHPKHRALRADLDRILKQRNALLRSTKGRLDADAAFTLDVWDSKLAVTGTALRMARVELLAELLPELVAGYDAVAGSTAEVGASYVSSWGSDLTAALEESREIDVRRGVTSVGPHRDEIEMQIGGLPARTHGSQGEQRSFALAMRLATDSVVRHSGTAEPILLLDDVFSELDPRRAGALLDALPPAQRLLTTASGLPPQAKPDQMLEVIDGTIRTT